MSDKEDSGAPSDDYNETLRIVEICIEDLELFWCPWEIGQVAYVFVGIVAVWSEKHVVLDKC